MNTSSRFVVAVHIASCLEAARRFRAEFTLSSGRLAESVGTNPVVVRRILRELRAAGLVASHPGANGGFCLTRPARETTLLDLYDAVESAGLFHYHYSAPSPNCPVGRTIGRVLRGPLEEAEHQMRLALGRQSLGSLVDEMVAIPRTEGFTRVAGAHV